MERSVPRFSKPYGENGPPFNLIKIFRTETSDGPNVLCSIQQFDRSKIDCVNVKRPYIYITAISVTISIKLTITLTSKTHNKLLVRYRPTV